MRGNILELNIGTVFRKRLLPSVRRNSPLALGLALAFSYITASAIDVRDAGESQDIIEKIKISSGGEIEVDIPEDLLEKICADPLQTKKTTNNSSARTTGRMNGFRIQVFSDGRNQHTLEARAKARGNAILAKFPKYRGQVYTNSSSPNWYTRIGNFRTNAEAQAALDELKRAFPQYSSEMRIVKSKVIISSN